MRFVYAFGFASGQHSTPGRRDFVKVRVFYHDKCFDGACSAALFSLFYRERIRDDVEFQYSGLVHRAGALFDESKFDGDENAIVDFKYSTSPKITWWFDHHLSAFLTPEDAAHYENDTSTKKFYDPDFKSCTKFIATIAETRFGFDPAPVAEVVAWADTIDGASYPDATTAVEMRHPAMKLTMAIESTQDRKFIPHLIPLLVSMPLDEILRQPFVADLLPPLFQRHERSLRLLRERAECKEGTVFFDGTKHSKLTCDACHVAGLFQTKKDADKMTMASMKQDRFCGACHNGKRAFSATDPKKCHMCHKEKKKKAQ